MKRGIEQRTVRSFCRRKDKINLQPEYQRGSVWAMSQKQLLIDSILRDIDIPKIYLRDKPSGSFAEEAIDGQQRLTAIWQFYENKFKLAKDADAVNGVEIAGTFFKDLNEDIKDAFESYELSVVILRDASDDDVEEMFLRLQNGTSLNAAEKRNALPGNMKSFIKELAKHKFFENCGFTSHRNAFDHLAAQMTLIELNGGPTNIKNTDLYAMYERETAFNANGPKALKIKKVLDSLLIAFPQKTPELKKFNAISMYILVSYLLEKYDSKNRFPEVGQWFIEFETWRRQDEDTPLDQREPEMVSYLDKIGHSTDSMESLSFRQEILLTRLFEKIPNFVPLDVQRSFTNEQRIAIYRRDKGICQVKIDCIGVKVEWDNWHADHIVPWSRGGKSLVENGQVSCPACNIKKSNSL